MSDAHESLGTYQQHGDELEVRFERFYPRSIETVWSALTELERLKDWMGASLVEARVGGRIELMIGGVQPMTGRILAWEPPKVLEFTWSNADTENSIVRYELFRDGAGARMIFTHKRIPYARSGLMLPGWHIFFARLRSLLDGTAPAQSWRDMQRVYVDHYQLRGVLLDVPKSNG
jgi:uncharacterized protein YndB with AHSA1/START domain